MDCLVPLLMLCNPRWSNIFKYCNSQQPARMYSLMAFSHFAKETAKVHFWRMTLPLFIYSRYFCLYSKYTHDVYLNFKWIERKILETNMMLSGKTKYSKCYTMQRNPVILDILKSQFLQHVLLKSLDCSVFSDGISGPKGRTSSWNWEQNLTSSFTAIHLKECCLFLLIYGHKTHYIHSVLLHNCDVSLL